ncbi:MAG: hypothetical protein HQL70_01530 [Magnetococcales bacterium]|nr:hypothetical protein [Magnetococcales bacterium]
MSDNPVSNRMNELIKIVEQNRDAKQQEILEAARSEAQQIVKNAHQLARKRVKEVVAQERRMRTEVENTVRARQETEQRQQQLQQSETLLKESRKILEKALVRRWQDQTARRAWLNYIAKQAGRFLPKGHWQIISPAPLDEGDIAHLKKCLSKKTAQSLDFQSEDKLVAGLKIGCKNAWVDGTLDILLADTRSIDAQLLGLIAATGKQS